MSKRNRRRALRQEEVKSPDERRSLERAFAMARTQNESPRGDGGAGDGARQMRRPRSAIGDR